MLSARPHGESGAVVSVLTENHGRHAGYMRGGQSSKMRAMLEPETGGVLRVRSAVPQPALPRTGGSGKIPGVTGPGGGVCNGERAAGRRSRETQTCMSHAAVNDTDYDGRPGPPFE